MPMKIKPSYDRDDYYYIEVDGGRYLRDDGSEHRFNELKEAEEYAVEARSLYPDLDVRIIQPEIRVGLDITEEPIVEVFESIPSSGGGGGGAFEYHYDFNNSQDQSDPRGGSGCTYDSGTDSFIGGSGATWGERNITMAHNSTGSWDGGAYIRHTFNGTTGQNDDGIHIVTNEMGYYGEYWVGVIVRIGSTWWENCVGIPKIMMPRVHRPFESVQHGEGPVIYEQNACSATPTYNTVALGSEPGDSGWGPEAGFSGTSTTPADTCGHAIELQDYAGQWLYYELGHVMGDGCYLSVFDRSGTIALVSNTSEQNWSYRYENVGSANAASTLLAEWRHVAYTNYDGSGADANTYYDVADVYFSSSYMGPPTGFVTG